MPYTKKETITVPLGDIKPNSQNEKIHTKDNMALIRASMSEIGYITPIVVDESNTILAGHGRYFVMQEDKVKKVEITKVYGLTDNEKNKFRLYDNQSSRTGKYDKELLVNTVGDILESEDMFNISILGIEGLADSFSDEVLTFDLGSTQLKKELNKQRIIIVFPEDTDKARAILEKNGLRHILGDENSK